MTMFEEFRPVVPIEDQDWRDRAACRGEDTDLFFPDRGQDTKAAKEICGRCPVRLDCLRYALAEGIKHGVWGGASERARRRMRKRRLEFEASEEQAS